MFLKRTQPTQSLQGKGTTDHWICNLSLVQYIYQMSCKVLRCDEEEKYTASPDLLEQSDMLAPRYAGFSKPQHGRDEI